MPAPDVQDVLDGVDLRPADLPGLIAELRVRLADEVAAVGDERDAVPVIDYDDIVRGRVPDGTHDAVRRRACVVVRNTFERQQAEEWDRELADYLQRNRFEERYAALQPERAATGSRIWGIYWSRPQVEARQHDRMATVRRFLNGFWRHESEGTTWFDPAHDIGYPDRVRRRAPGVESRGLLPHVDSVARLGWREEENRRVFRHVFAGEPDRFDPWHAAHRTDPSSSADAPSAVFRTFQGWTALSEMRPEDGGLHILPIPAAITLSMLDGLLRSVLADEPDGAPRARPDDALLPALTPVPPVEPGDTVWWHGDLFHSVADASSDERAGNVMYIGVAPRCARNDAYVATMPERFVTGRSPADFPPEDHEVDFVGRASVSDLDGLGREQFGLEPIVRT